MLKIYGSMLCPDCVQCREELDRAGVEYEYLDFGDSLKNLKEFLAIRDNSSLFDSVREAGSIGIPCIMEEDGTIALDWDKYL
ncbi:MAG: glutaredoxin [Oscillospiraceae bacterium]|nr:glutaredoxin [Oscillospiraceae bacterium]